jgi:xanthine dehydrogenase YagR molybdenum-binding subunit
VSVATRTVGAPVQRVEGNLKVTGEARYAYEHRAERLAYGWIVQSPIARGRLRNGTPPPRWLFRARSRFSGTPTRRVWRDT